MEDSPVIIFKLNCSSVISAKIEGSSVNCRNKTYHWYWEPQVQGWLESSRQQIVGIHDMSINARQIFWRPLIQIILQVSHVSQLERNSPFATHQPCSTISFSNQPIFSPTHSSTSLLCLAPQWPETVTGLALSRQIMQILWQTSELDPMRLAPNFRTLWNLFSRMFHIVSAKIAVGELTCYDDVVLLDHDIYLSRAFATFDVFRSGEHMILVILKILVVMSWRITVYHGQTRHTFPGIF